LPGSNRPEPVTRLSLVHQVSIRTLSGGPAAISAGVTQVVWPTAPENLVSIARKPRVTMSAMTRESAVFYGRSLRRSVNQDLTRFAGTGDDCNA
jgi:hypothetical protein